MIDIIVDERELSFNRLEKEIYAFGCQIARKMLKNVLEALDKKLAKERDKSIYRHKGTRETSVKTLIWEVEFSRVVYKYYDEGKTAYIYLLDQLLGFDTIGLISTNLAENIVENASVTSYHNTANNITELTGQSISHGGVYINIQGKDRPKSGKKLEMKVAVAYEGWKEVSKDRYELVNKVACAGFEDISEFYRIKEAMIAKEYNIDEIQVRILNGDGAPMCQDSCRIENNV